MERMRLLRHTFNRIDSIRRSWFKDAPIGVNHTTCRLPVELVSEILLYAQYSNAPDAIVAPAYLCTFALVCRAWSWVAQGLLFSFVYLDSTRQVEIFRSAVNPQKPKGAYLGGSVRTFVITLSNTLTGYHFARAIERCTNVESLDIRAHPSTPSFDHRTISLLRQLNHPSSLAVEYRHGCNILPQLLCIWPSIEFLDVWLIGPAIESAVAGIDTPPSLYELGWHVTGSEESSFTALYSLLSASRSSLKILDIATIPRDSQSCQLFFETLGPNLLALHVFMPIINDGTAHAVIQCPGLKEFRYNGVLPYPVVDALPNTVEHIAFSGINGSVEPLVNSLSRLVSLSTITWDRCSRVDKEFHNLYRACTERGIDLQCFADDAYYFKRMMVRIRSPVKSDKFPRYLPDSSRRIVSHT